MLDENIKIFIVYITFLNFSKLTIIIHLVKKAQIVLLLAKKIKISIKYLDFSNIFLEKNALILLELVKFNQHIIKLLNN